MYKLLPLLSLAALSLGCQQAFLDGAWTGTLECNNVRYDVDAQLDQSLETGDVEGDFFIEYEVDLGIFGRHRIWEKGSVDDGEWDPVDERFSGRVIADDDQADNQAPDWLFDLGPDEDYEELSGALERLNDDGEVVMTCDADMTPVAVPNN